MKVKWSENFILHSFALSKTSFAKKFAETNKANNLNYEYLDIFLLEFLRLKKKYIVHILHTDGKFI